MTVDQGRSIPESERLPHVIVANVAIISVTNGSARFLVRRLSATHQWAPGKLDLLSVDSTSVPDPTLFTTFRKAAIAELEKEGFVATMDARSLGGSRRVATYEGKPPRDTRRLFLSATVQNTSLTDNQKQQGYCWLTIEEVHANASTFRRPELLDALDSHAVVARGGRAGSWRISIDESLIEYAEKNIWSFEDNV